MWLFGSRAKGSNRPDSDHDIAIELCPKKGNHDWALGDYVFLFEDWKDELRAIVKTDVSLVAMRDDIDNDTPFDPREFGIRLWSRSM